MLGFMIAAWQGVEAEYQKIAQSLMGMYWGAGRPPLYRLLPNVVVMQSKPDTFWEDALYSNIQESECGQFLLCGNFDLYRRDELSDALGMDHKSSTNAALTMAAWQKWGRDCAARLQGDFGFSIYDRSTGNIHLVTDPFAQKAVYYYCKDGVRIAAPTVPLLLSNRLVRRDLNLEYIAHFMADSASAEETIYQHIKRVRWGGEIILKEDGATEFRSYWEPNTTRHIHFKNENDYVEAAKEIFDRNVLDAARSKGPIVSTISGGLDASGLVGTLAQSKPNTPIHAFSCSLSDAIEDSGNPQFDESSEAAASCDIWENVHYQHVWVKEKSGWIDPSSWFGITGCINRTPYQSDLTIGAFEHAAKLGAKKLLNGVYGNLTLSYDGALALAYWLKTGRLDKVLLNLPNAHKDFASGRFSRKSFLWRMVLAPNLPMPIKKRVRSLYGFDPEFPWRDNSLVNPRFASNVDLDGRMHDVWGGDPAREWSVDTRDNRVRMFTTHMPLASDILEPLMHRYNVLFADPYAKSNLFDFCLSIPDEQFFKRGVTRRLARRVLAGRINPHTLKKPVQAMGGGNRFRRMSSRRNDMAEQIARIEKSDAASRVLDVPRMKQLLADWPKDSEWYANRHAPRLQGWALPLAIHAGQFIRWAEGANE